MKKKRFFGRSGFAGGASTSNGHEVGLLSSIFDDLEARKSCTPGATFHIGFRSRGRRFPTKKNPKLPKPRKLFPGPPGTLPDPPGPRIPGSPGPRGPGKKKLDGGESEPQPEKARKSTSPRPETYVKRTAPSTAFEPFNIIENGAL